MTGVISGYDELEIGGIRLPSGRVTKRQPCRIQLIIIYHVRQFVEHGRCK